jgi:transcriptional regulator with GAF, ATPase, and Fis domain
LSPRSGKAFVDQNCAAVPATLLESELFGHERGAFTGAGNEKPGLVEVADGGTLFLDEVGEMAPEIQSKFLRVLDSGTFYRVGATRKRRADFRLVAATNRDLAGEVAAGRFRKDLFYRIHGVKVVIPPLRERPEDIPLLVEHFARQLPLPKRFSAAALAAFSAHDWPGNVRELHFAVVRAGLLSEGEGIGVEDLPPEILERSGHRPAIGLGAMAAAAGGGETASAQVRVPPPGAPPLPATPVRPPAPPPSSPGETGSAEDDDDFSRNGPDAARVRAALEKSRWRREQAAELLGVSPRTLYRWMKRLGL